MRYILDSDHQSFWGKRMEQVCTRMIPLQLSILKDEAPNTEPSHAIENLEIAAGLKQGTFYGMVFQDSDVGKWIESAAYRLMLGRDDALEAEVDRIIDVMAKAQQPDGYLNSYFTVKEPGKRWTNLEQCHELYCAGHLMEGAVAYAQATGKTKFLDIMCRMADHIDGLFGPGEDQKRGYPGHPEIEIGLWRLYKQTGSERYLKLAKYFVDERGREPYYFDKELEARGGGDHFAGLHALGREYLQGHAPVREQKDAVGHSVRALYLYTAMADIAAETGDESLLKACDTLWDSAVNRRMYITGGFGGTHIGEAFLGDYELPNDTAYAETCASVAAVFFGRALLRCRRDGAVADTVERILYNGMLSGMSLGADRFYYVNPLEVMQGVSGKQAGFEHVLPERPKWFACACCPPNMARLITSLPEYCYQEEADGITVHQYLGGRTELSKADITLTTAYPWNGDLAFDVDAREDFILRIRIPGWCDKAEAWMNGETVPMATESGYLSIPVKAGKSTVRLSLDMQPKRWYAHPAVRADVGCVAFTYGPMVYCFEGVENPEPLSALRVTEAPAVMGDFDASLLGGVRTLTVEGIRLTSADGALYSTKRPTAEKVSLTAVPYYAWANREAKDMRVWMAEA